LLLGVLTLSVGHLFHDLEISNDSYHVKPDAITGQVVVDVRPYLHVLYK
jgi:hypothetical protein